MFGDLKHSSATRKLGNQKGCKYFFAALSELYKAYLYLNCMLVNTIKTK